jgi:hypothetical protein
VSCRPGSGGRGGDVRLDDVAGARVGPRRKIVIDGVVDLVFRAVLVIFAVGLFVAAMSS